MAFAAYLRSRFMAMTAREEEQKSATDMKIQASLNGLLDEYAEALRSEDPDALLKASMQVTPIVDRNWSRMTQEQQDRFLGFSGTKRRSGDRTSLRESLDRTAK